MPYPIRSEDELERMREVDFRAAFGERLEDFVERQFRERSKRIARRFKEQSQEIVRLKVEIELLKSNLKQVLKAPGRKHRRMLPETASALLHMAGAVEHDVDPAAIERVIDWLKALSTE